MKTISSLFLKLTILVSLVNVLLVVVCANLKPTGNGMILVTALTTLPFDIDGVMAFPYYILDKPYVEGSSLLPAAQSAVTPLTAVHATDRYVRFNNVTMNSSIAALPVSNDNELIAPIHEGNTNSPHSRSITRSVIASIVIALLIFITSLIVLYLWRHYYPPPRKTRSQISQGSAGSYPVAGNHWSSTRSLSQ